MDEASDNTDQLNCASIGSGRALLTASNADSRGNSEAVAQSEWTSNRQLFLWWCGQVCD